mmetsp:Transcript_90347/g.292436  ORF Transcript_90347/g.292436 Transcript_90347/m.292436 type:complete len:558 (+) Transcript_90347:141-1814(+)
MRRPKHQLERLEVRPIAKAAGPKAEAAAEAWVRAREACGACVAAGEVFAAGDHEFAVSSCAPLNGGALSARTELTVGSVPLPVLERVQLTYLDAAPDGGDAEDVDSRIYQEFVRPLLLALREERRREGCRALLALSQDQVVNAAGHDFGVRALDPDPPGRCGVLYETTAVFVSQVETPALSKVHVLPYEDTLPAAYKYDLFKDLLQPFFQAHPFAVYGEGDHFTYRGVRFRVMATDPHGVLARVSNQTLVFADGEALRPTIWDLMLPEQREEIMRLPRGLQMLLLNTMANEEAVHGRLAEVHEVLRRGQGLASSEISNCGRAVVWRSAERAGDTQQQCMVCLAEFAEGESLRQLGCDHLFHRQCIDEWLRRSAACPICKQPAGTGEGSQGGGAAAGAGRASSAGLLQGARVAFDGSHTGTITGLDSGRFVVAPDAGGQEQLVLPDGLVQRIAGVRLVGLRSTEFNGLMVQIVGLDATRARYQVRLDGSRVLAVRPENCILPEGAVARVVGLRGDGPGSRWNGHFGRVVSFDDPRMRHILAMQPRGQLLSVKPKNLRV